MTSVTSVINIVAGWPRRRQLLVLWLLGLTVYSLLAWNRLAKRSDAPHYVQQANAWLDGRLDIEKPHGNNDWVMLWRYKTKAGHEVLGRPMVTDRRLIMLQDGSRVPRADLKRAPAKPVFMMSFPPTPAVLMLPQVLVRGEKANDVVFTIFFASLVVPLFFLVLERLRDARLSSRRPRENLWLTLALAFGSVFFFVAVQGTVWYTAQVCGVFFLLGFLLFSISARNPWLAGLCLGLAATSRTPLAFAFFLFIVEARRIHPSYFRDFAVTCLKFAIPVAIIAAAAAYYNYVRFHSPLEFGHNFLQARQQALIEVHGLFDTEYLWRNLKVAFTLLPGLDDGQIKISGHGLALWITMPYMLLALWPKPRGHASIGLGPVSFGATRDSHLTIPLVLAIFAVAAPTIMYQNTGWFQFGYRFAVDYWPLVIILWAVAGKKLTTSARTLIIVAMLINLFGAITFNRMHKYYDFTTYKSIRVNTR